MAKKTQIFKADVSRVDDVAINRRHKKSISNSIVHIVLKFEIIWTCMWNFSIFSLCELQICRDGWLICC
jgi:hypothetical protein